MSTIIGFIALTFFFLMGGTTLTLAPLAKFIEPYFDFSALQAFGYDSKDLLSGNVSIDEVWPAVSQVWMDMFKNLFSFIG